MCPSQLFPIAARLIALLNQLPIPRLELCKTMLQCLPSAFHFCGLRDCLICHDRKKCVRKCQSIPTIPLSMLEDFKCCNLPGPAKEIGIGLKLFELRPDDEIRFLQDLFRTLRTARLGQNEQVQRSLSLSEQLHELFAGSASRGMFR